jgi:hypothetical protein
VAFRVCHMSLALHSVGVGLLDKSRPRRDLTDMPEIPNTSVTGNDQQKSRRRSIRRRLLIWSGFGFCIPLAWLLWMLFGWLPHIAVSPQTTWLTSPLNEDGGVDYLRDVKERHQQRGGKDQSEDRWVALHTGEIIRNGGMASADKIRTLLENDLSPDDPLYVDPVTLFEDSLSSELSNTERQDQKWTFTNETLPRLARVPWTAAEHPSIARTIEQNLDWYREIEDSLATVGALGFPKDKGSPINEGVGSITLESMSRSRLITERFLLRAAHRFGSGDTLLALHDIDFLSRAAEHYQFCMVELVNRSSIEAQILRTLCMGLLSGSPPNQDAIALISDLPSQSVIPQYLEMLQIERLIRLDGLVRVHDAKLIGDTNLLDPAISNKEEWVIARFAAASVDWEALMRHENQLIDEAIQAVSKETWTNASRQLSQLFDPPLPAVAARRFSDLNPWSVSRTPQDLRAELAREHDFVIDGYFRATEMLLRRRVVQLISRLVLWKQKHGQYPQQLLQLESLAEFHYTTDELFIDPFTSQPLQYITTGDGFEIRSAGKNGVVETGGWEGFTGEQQVTASTDDYFWRWPLPAE